MTLYSRVCNIQITTDNEEINIKDLKIVFNVFKTRTSNGNRVEVSIYNIADDTINLFANSDAHISVYAGYEQDAGLLLAGEGDITSIRILKERVNRLLYITATEQAISRKHTAIILSFSDTVTFEDMIKDIELQSGIKIIYDNIDTSIVEQNGYSDIGSIESIMDNLALTFDFTYSIQNNVLVCKGNKPRSYASTYTLNSSTGLIMTPESFKKQIKKINNLEDNVTKLQLTVTSLLNPRLQVYDVIDLESSVHNGQFKILEIEHKGDTMGTEWYSILLLEALA